MLIFLSLYHVKLITIKQCHCVSTLLKLQCEATLLSSMEDMLTLLKWAVPIFYHITNVLRKRRYLIIWQVKLFQGRALHSRVQNHWGSNVISRDIKASNTIHFQQVSGKRCKFITADPNVLNISESEKTKCLNKPSEKT